MVLTWDVERILDALGGAQAFSNECSARGWTIAPTTICKWRERSRIPAHGLAAVALVMEDRGHPPITDFIIIEGADPARDRDG